MHPAVRYSQHPFDLLILTWPLGLEIQLVAIAQDAADKTDASRIQTCFQKFCEAWAGLAKHSDMTGSPFARLNSLRALTRQLEALEQTELTVSPIAAELQRHGDWLDRIEQQAQAPLILLQDPPDISENAVHRLLRWEVHSGIERLFSARDQGIRSTRSPPDPPPVLSPEHIAIHRLIQFLDHVLEEVEALCLGVGSLTLGQLQYRVDTAQRFMHQGLQLEQAVDDEAMKALIIPLLGNIQGFFEAFDQVLHAFQENPDNACALALALLTLHEYLSQQPDGQRWHTELLAIRRLIDQRKTADTLWSPGGEAGRLRKTLYALRQGRPGKLQGTAVPVNSLALFRKLHSWLCLGPRLLTGLALTVTRQTVEDRHIGRTGKLLRAFQPPADLRRTALDRWQACSNRGLRHLARWGAWLVPLLIYGPWLLMQAEYDLPVDWPVTIPGDIVGAFILLALLPLLLLLLSRLPEWTSSRLEHTAEGTFGDWWREVSGVIHRHLLLPPFLFKAGFGVAVAVTIEFDYQFWLVGLRSVWLEVTGLLLLLCAMGCYAQVRIRSLGVRLLATVQILGIYTALSHLPAVLAAWVLHDALRGLVVGGGAGQDADVVSLPATIPLSGFGEISLYCVLFMALTGMVIGIVGDTFLERSRDRNDKGG